jgi:cephalosporin hydroxylase
MTIPHMESSLNFTLRTVLEMMQARHMERTTYFGIPTFKCPLDWWVYQEIIVKAKPDVIVEIGTYQGGLALSLAHICDHLGKGRVIAVDINPVTTELVKKHPRIQLIVGDACQSFEQINALIKPTDEVLIIEDSAHTFENTLRVLNTYSPLVKVGGYFIVEDGVIGHGLPAIPGMDPYGAITSFLAGNGDFITDRSQESFFITWNPTGYLKRIR